MAKQRTKFSFKYGPLLRMFIRQRTRLKLYLCRDADKIGSDEFMGQAIVNVSDLQITRVEQTLTVTLTPRPGKKDKVSGTVELRYTYVTEEFSEKAKKVITDRLVQAWDNEAEATELGGSFSSHQFKSLFSNSTYLGLFCVQEKFLNVHTTVSYRPVSFGTFFFTPINSLLRLSARASTGLPRYMSAMPMSFTSIGMTT